MIKIKIKFFAKLKEDIGHESLSISLENPTKVIEFALKPKWINSFATLFNKGFKNLFNLLSII